MFGFKLKKKHEAGCCCGKKEESLQNELSADAKDAKIETIKVLGTGTCANCHTLYKRACEATAELNLGIEAEYVTDMKQIISYGVMSLPALVVNGKPVSAGRVLKKEEIIRLLGC